MSTWERQEIQAFVQKQKEKMEQASPEVQHALALSNQLHEAFSKANKLGDLQTFHAQRINIINQRL